MKLTTSQQAAVEHEGGHLQLIACAGSGKTEVVAQRIARILDPRRQDPCQPRSIVAFTFTDRAADELEARVHRRVRERYGPLPAMAELYIGTIHSFCLQLLQSEVSEHLRLSVIDAVGQRMLVAREPERSGFSLATTLDGQPLSLDKDIGRYLAALDVLRQGEVDRTQLGPCTIGAALERYRALLAQESLLDYTAQLELALDMIRRDVDVGSRLAARLRHVIVDEYQDTNPLQERLVRALAEVSGAHLTVVGDDDQTIYNFNGADIENILTFADRYRSLAPVRTVRLEENFRSSAPIVEFARAFAARITPRLPKAMIATDAQAAEDGDLAFGAFRGRFDEARAIARKIHALRESSFVDAGVERGLSWSDFAVLFRGGLHYNCNELLKVFDETGIPYVVTGRKGLLVQRECLALRAAVAFFADGETASRAAARSQWLSSELSASSAAVDHALDALAAARLDPSVESIQTALLRALDAGAVRERAPHDLRFANVGRFSALLAQFERVFARSPTLERAQAFVAYCDRSEGEHEEATGVSEQQAIDAVRVSTVHAAKGLQWPAVFLPRVEEGQFAARYREPQQWAIVPKDVVRRASRYDCGEPEERRLFYVAATRAQRYLFVSAAGQHNNPARPSAFYGEFRDSGFATETLVRATRPSRRRPAQPRLGTGDQRLSFSQLKPLFECAYRFELQSRYGFTPPHHRAEGFGVALHNALAEVHRRAIDGDLVEPSLAEMLCERHLRLPYADDESLARYARAMQRILRNYLHKNQRALARVELVEKVVRVHLDEGISVEGRIDLVLRVGDDDRGACVVDLKSDHRAQSETLTHTQLLLYALGYEELRGRRADAIEVWELDTLEQRSRPLDAPAIAEARQRVIDAARLLRGPSLPPAPSPDRCAKCPVRAVCRHRAADSAPAVE